MHDAVLAASGRDGNISTALMETAGAPSGAYFRLDSGSLRDEPREAGGDGLLAAVRRSLRASQYRELQRLQVAICDRAVVLKGSVPSYHLKQVAQTAVLQVEGVRSVRNDLHVARR